MHWRAVLAILTIGCTQPTRVIDDPSQYTFRCDAKPESRYDAFGIQVNVASDSCIDASGPLRDGGLYEWLYVYDTYTFRLGEVELTARSYADSSEAHFLRIVDSDGLRFLAVADFETPLLRAAIQYLAETGNSEITWLDRHNDVEGYSPVPAR